MVEGAEDIRRDDSTRRQLTESDTGQDATRRRETGTNPTATKDTLPMDDDQCWYCQKPIKPGQTAVITEAGTRVHIACDAIMRENRTKAEAERSDGPTG